MWDQAGEGVGNYSVGFPLSSVHKMKSPSPSLATGFCFGMRWQGHDPPRVQTARKDCTKSNAVTALKLLSCWGFFVWCFFNAIIFFLQTAWLDPLIVIYLFFVREEEFPAFHGVFGIDPLGHSGVGDRLPPRHCHTLPTFYADPLVALCSISHWINCYKAISLNATVCCSCFPAPTSTLQLIQPAVCLLQSRLPTAAAHKLL